MSERIGQMSRADLLDALASGHTGRINQVAKQLQLNTAEERAEAEQPKSDESSTQNLKKEDFHLLRSANQARTTAGFWRLVSREAFDVPDNDETPLPSVPSADWDGRPKTPCRYRLLQEPEVFIHQYLNPLLNQNKPSGRKLDTEKLVEHISQAKALVRLPRKPYRLSPHFVQVIDDRHTHLIPYWTDQSVYRRLSLGRQRQLATEAILQEGRQRPMHLDRTKGYRDWEVPPSGSMVLIFSDLGALSQQPDAQIDTWLDIGRELQRQNCRGVVLLPCRVSVCDKRFHSYFELMSLVDRPTTGEATIAQDLSASLLLTALAPALRIEPGLLRQMRLEMAQHGGSWKMSAEVESLLWQHPDIQESHSVAATWNQASRTQRLVQFSQLSIAEKRTALNVIKQWRQPLSAQVWFEEIISLDEESRALQASDLQAAVSYFAQLSHTVQDSSLLVHEVELKEWLQRVSLRVPDTVYFDSLSGKALQRIKRQVLPENTDLIDPSMLFKSHRTVQTVMLYQQGELIKIMPFQEQYKPDIGYSPLATLKMAHDLLQVIVDGKQVGSLSFSERTELSLPRRAKKMVVKSDRESLSLELLHRDFLLKESDRLNKKGADIYLSYRHSNTRVAQRLVHSLEQLGYSVWWDRKLQAGHDLSDFTRRKMSEAKCIIVLWTPDSGESSRLFADARFAGKRGVLLNAAYREAPIPAPFQGGYSVNLRGWNGDVLDEDLQKLVDGVSRINSVSNSTLKTAIGRDQYGLYADINLTPEHIQRFRWIPAGTFMMGSPEDEPEREFWAKETQHQVTFSEGFWLADTTVTQAQWQAVTGNNPSNFKGENRPVEEVSWKDAQGFINTINSGLPHLELGLPSEAQWEYACRAGTTTPFSFGKNITSDQVNYNGNNPYASAEKGEYRKGTVPVKLLPANPWGLYEMHGNLWEWCQDVWQEDLGSHALIDPKNEPPQAEVEKGASRVVRGGSWNDYGRDVRSACRVHFSPGGRNDDVGFRLFLVNPCAVAQTAEP